MVPCVLVASNTYLLACLSDQLTWSHLTNYIVCAFIYVCVCTIDGVHST